MTLSPNTDLRRYPTLAEPATRPADGPRIVDLTHRPRMGLRGKGTPEWCRTNGLPFPDMVNGVARAEGLRIGRLGRFELLVLPDGDVQFPDGLGLLPDRTYSGYREETWAWFRMEGAGALDALASCTSAQLTPNGGHGEHVVQTRFAGLDAVLIVAGSADEAVVDIFFDIASHGYLAAVFADRCPDFAICRSD